MGGFQHPVKQGDIFWVSPGPPRGSEPGYRHPHVVIQNNIPSMTVGLQEGQSCHLDEKA